MRYTLRFSALKLAVLTSALLTAAVANAQWAPVGMPGISPGGLSNWQHLIIDANNTPYVSFNDEGLTNTSGEGTLMRFDGTNWDTIGNAGFTAGIAHHSSFAIGPNGTYYFSYADGNNVSRAAVMMYNGTSWVSIGSSLSVGECQYSTMRVVNDTPYVAFIDNGNATVNVLKYNGTSWLPLGGGPVASTPASYATLVTDNFDSLYVAYQDNGNGGKATVQKFNGTSWNLVGTAFLSQTNGGAYDISVAFNSSNVPYVAYWNPYPAGPAPSVEKFDGTNWVNVGAPSFTSTIVQFTSIAIGTNDTPYVAFNEATNGSKAAVVKFDGTNWVYVGTEGFSGSTAAYTSLAIDGNGNPYVAYYDESNGGKTTVMKYTTCNAPDVPVVATSDTTLCLGDTATLTATGNLNDATQWYWFTGSCGGTLVDSGASISVAPHDTTVYYVRGLGNCVVSGACSPVAINVDSVATPTISVNNGMLTSSTAGSYQWSKNDIAISGATNQTYQATHSAWYTVTVNDGHCSATSDSVHVQVNDGVATISSGAGIRVYPTLFENVVNLEIDNSNAAQCSVMITDNLGRVIYQKDKLSNTNVIDLHQLSAAIYYVSVEAPTGRQEFKIVKQ